MSSKYKVHFHVPTAPLALAGLLAMACGGEDRSHNDECPTDHSDPADCADWNSWLQNVEDGLAVLDRADSAALAVEELLLDIRARTVRAGSEVTDQDERVALQQGYATLLAALEQIAASTDFDGTPLTDGSSATWDVTTGDDTADVVSIPLADLSATALGLSSATVDLTSVSTALPALDTEADALALVAAWRTSLADEREVLLAIGEMLTALCTNCASASSSSEETSEGSFALEPTAGEQAVIQALLDNIAEAREALSLADAVAEDDEAILARIRELALTCASETLADDERTYFHWEFQHLSATLDALAESAEYNGLDLTDGTTGMLGALVDDCSAAECRYDIVFTDLTAQTLGVDTATMDLSSAAGAQTAIDGIDTAIDSVASYRASFGAQDDALEIIEALTARQLEE